MVLNSKWQVQEGRKGIGMSVLTKIAPRPNDGQKNLHSGQEGARVTSAGDGSHEVPKLDGRLGERSGPVAHI